ncbi:hypothetical protein H0A36_03955 [Endozoicomonas sp. SM1973]|uniref:Thioredoxin-like fold domain-containing protein n=1 Tax=Spartinivicinus marinus TaxID=2994442 RepID=A0A853HTR0_9GAMM|nr:hypothetical protein [Spartinivicinus marinus]MCX4029575.1 hypothetical protein [Spartinivicinus marinus]NYZ65150.1 hypothetical protein [Spartinivicinus marinus]
MTVKITLVKKVLADGSPCKKCIDVLQRLEKSGHIKHIERIVEAHENDPNSEGMQLAQSLQVDKAPFFIVDHPDGQQVVYTVYFKLVQEVLKHLS